MTDPRPFRLGVTGGIASGKSTVMAILAELGAETIDADRVYHWLIEPGRPLHRVLVERWGRGIVATDGMIDRPALGRIVFADPAELADLDRLTHPAIRREIDNRVQRSNADVVAIDAVKLIESGHADSCDRVWLIVADPALQSRRLVETRGLTMEDALRRVTSQPDVAPRLARANTVIRNEGSLDDLQEGVVTAWRQLPIS